MAVEGHQPVIPLNPAPSQLNADGTLKTESVDENTGVPLSAPGGSGPGAMSSGGAGQAGGQKSLVEHVLSKEEISYYETVTYAMKWQDLQLRKAVFRSLSLDPGAQQLLPYLVQFIADEVTHNLSRLEYVTSLVQMASCILDNGYFHIEPYVRLSLCLSLCISLSLSSVSLSPHLCGCDSRPASPCVHSPNQPTHSDSLSPSLSPPHSFTN